MRFFWLPFAALLLALPSASQSVPSWAAPERQSPETSEAVSRSMPGSRTPGEKSPQDPAPAVPVDGGLLLLALAGAGYGAHRLRGSRTEPEVV